MFSEMYIRSMQNNLYKISHTRRIPRLFCTKRHNFLFANYFNLTTKIMIIISRNKYASVNTGCREKCSQDTILVNHCNDVNDFFHWIEREREVFRFWYNLNHQSNLYIQKNFACTIYHEYSLRKKSCIIYLFKCIWRIINI